jgi:hypothetical protein
MGIDNIPDSYFEGRNFTREGLRSAVARFNAELQSPEFAAAFDGDPEISPEEAALTAEYVSAIEAALSKGAPGGDI